VNDYTPKTEGRREQREKGELLLKKKTKGKRIRKKIIPTVTFFPFFSLFYFTHLVKGSNLPGSCI